ncbi:MAG: thermonuclease family protein [Mariniblastus sp.]
MTNLKWIVLTLLLLATAGSIAVAALLFLNSVEDGQFSTAGLFPGIATDEELPLETRSLAASGNTSSKDAGAPSDSRNTTEKNPANESKNFESGYFDAIPAKNASTAEPGTTKAPAKKRTTRKTSSKKSTSNKPSPDTKPAASGGTEESANTDPNDNEPTPRGKVRAPNSIFGKPIVESVQGKCIGCSDGDTLTILSDGKKYRIRLDSIDCPESQQPFGQNAKRALSKMVYGKTVTVHATGKDDYDRVLGFVLVRKTNVNEQLIKLGLAWHYRQYSNSTELSKLEAKSRSRKTGLWSDKNPTPPWNWRRSQSDKIRR